MPSFHAAIPLCAAALVLMCTACTVTPPAQSLSAPPEPPFSAISEGDTPQFSASVPGSPLPDESSIPALFIPENSPSETPPPPPAKPPVPAERPTSEPPAPDTDSSAPPPPEAQDQAHQTEPTQPDAPLPASDYDFSRPVPESPAAENGYFADAAFVGDSRSEGFYLYGVKQGKNLSSSGLSVFNLSKKKSFSCNGASCTALEVLSANEYTKVYLGFGINELGYISTDAFYRAYCDTIDAVRTCQPQAVVYVQTMAPVNEGRVAATGGAGHLNNDRVRLYNDLIRKAAAEKQVPLLDLYSLFAVDGTLPAEASRDGVHLTGDYCRKQLEYLKTHTVSFDTLYPLPNTETEVLPNETPDPPAPDPLPDSNSGSLLPPDEAPPLPAEPVPDRSIPAV